MINLLVLGRFFSFRMYGITAKYHSVHASSEWWKEQLSSVQFFFLDYSLLCAEGWKNMVTFPFLLSTEGRIIFCMCYGRLPFVPVDFGRTWEGQDCAVIFFCLGLIFMVLSLLPISCYCTLNRLCKL